MANLSQFPENLDNFQPKRDLTYSELLQHKRWYELKLKETRTSAEDEEYINLTVSLRPSLLLPDDLNILYDAMSNMQVFTKQTLENYYRYRGDWTSSPSEPYDVFNSVMYPVDGHIYLAYNLPGNALPTDNTKWIKITAKGDQGVQGIPGIGLNYREEFFASTPYLKDDLVTWKGNTYYCKQNIQDVFPSDTTYWTLFTAGNGENLNDLLTNVKTSLVGAINEVNIKVDDVINDLNNPEYYNGTTEGSITHFDDSVYDGELKLDLKGQTFTNIIKNGNFNNGTDGWESGGFATLSAANNIMTVEANGVEEGGFLLRKDLGSVNVTHNYFTRIKFKVTNSVCEVVGLSYDGSITGLTKTVATVSAPTKDVEYTLYTINTPPTDATGDFKIIISHNYSDTATSTGKVMEIQEVMAIDLDNHPELQDKTADEINEFIPHWFDGTKSATPSRVRVTGKNIWGGRKAAEDIVNVADNSDYTYITNVDGRNVLVMVGGNASYKKIPYDNFKPNKVYTLQYRADYDEENYGAYLSFRYTDGSTDGLRPAKDYGVVSKTSNAEKTVSYIYITYSYGEKNTYIDTDSIMLEEGDTASTYEPYTESLRYIDPSITLRSLPNGIYNEVTNKGEHIQRISNTKIINGNFRIMDVFDRYRHVDATVINIAVNIDNTTPETTNYINDNALLISKNVKFAPNSLYGVQNEVWNMPNSYSIIRDLTDDGYMWIRLSLSHTDTGWSDIPSLPQVQNYFDANPIRLNYQLATPIIKQISTSPLTIEPNGSLFFDNVIGEVSVASSAPTCWLSNPDFKIESIERLYKVDQNTGIKTPLDISLVDFSIYNRLGFTHPQIQEGDLIDWDYVYSTELSTVPVADYSYPLNVNGAVASALDVGKANAREIRNVGKEVDWVNEKADIFEIQTNNYISSFRIRIGNIEDRIDDTQLKLGRNAVASGLNSTGVGYFAQATANNATALGNAAQAQGDSSTAVGSNSDAIGANSIAHGKNAQALGMDAIAIGANSDATKNNSTALGDTAQATGENATAIGRDTTASGVDSFAGGGDAAALGDNSVAVGRQSVALSAGSIALGQSASAVGTYSTSVGAGSDARMTGATALGKYADASKDNSTAIGSESNASASRATALGNNADASGTNSTAIGYNTLASNMNEIVLGTRNDTITASGTISAGIKNFEIPHPKPEKKDTHRLRHGCVESPTAGDTLDRYRITATQDDETVIVHLPDYYQHLNKNVDVWVNGCGHYYRGYGEVIGNELHVTCEKAGQYKVLVIGTRNDDAVQDWDIKGVERENGESWLGETYAFEVDEIIEVEEITEV